MPRFWRLRGFGTSCGPRVMTRPHVISGPASSGQQVCTGSCARSTSSPSTTLRWHSGLRTVRGAMSRSALIIDSSRPASLKPRGGSGSFSRASSVPTSRSDAIESWPMPAATRSTVPNRLPSTGIVAPTGCSNSSAGPPRRNVRSQISVISSFGEIGVAMRFRLPARSSCATKSRRSSYFWVIDRRDGRDASCADHRSRCHGRSAASRRSAQASTAYIDRVHRPRTSTFIGGRRKLTFP